MKDWAALRGERLEGIAAEPFPDDLLRWRAVLMGPADSPYYGGTFLLDIRFSEDYPAKAPKVKFVNQNVFHPNVYDSGDICLDLLQNRWSPSYDLVALLCAIRSLLTDPNPDSPANHDAAKLLTGEPGEFRRRVHRCVELTLFDSFPS
jgi:ubiquitin-conjugating enzyme E2 A